MPQSQKPKRWLWLPVLAFAVVAIAIGIGLQLKPVTLSKTAIGQGLRADKECGTPLSPNMHRFSDGTYLTSEADIYGTPLVPVTEGEKAAMAWLECEEHLGDQRAGGIMLAVAGVAVVPAWFFWARRKPSRRVPAGGAQQASTDPPGWHADPLGTHAWRWWDGNTWTDHTSDNAQRPGDPTGIAPPGGQPSPR